MSSATPEVSIILPTCDRPELVGRALASLIGQTFADCEIILVDVNRKTPPVAAIPALASLLCDPRVRVIDGRATSSAATSRNLGLRAARGRWVTFLDDDDEYLPEKVAAQHALASTHNLPFVICGYEFVWPRRRRIRQIHQARFRGDEMITHTAFNTPLLFHRRDDSIRFDEHLSAGEDVAYVLSFIERYDLRELACVTRPLVIVHPQPAGRSVHADKEAVWRACRACWKISRHRLSRAGRRAFLAHSRLQRAIGGHGDARHLFRCALAVLRTRGIREYRLVIFALLTRFRARVQPAINRV